MFHSENRHGVELVEIKSSLKLQVLMYYQWAYSLLYWAVAGGCLLNKKYNYEFNNAILELLTVPIFMLWSMIEVARVGLGYVGNIKEKVPMVSAFLLLTIFPQSVAVVFLAYLQDPLFPFDSIGGTIMVVFLVLELIVGKRTLDALITRQTAQFFRLCQEAECSRMRDMQPPGKQERDMTLLAGDVVKSKAGLSPPSHPATKASVELASMTYRSQVRQRAIPRRRNRNEDKSVFRESLSTDEDKLSDSEVQNPMLDDHRRTSRRIYDDDAPSKRDGQDISDDTSPRYAEARS